MSAFELKEPIYLRQDGESDEAFRAFEMYRETPVHKKRSYKDVAETSNLSPSTVNTYGSRYKWKERVLAYDRFQDSETLRQINRRRVEMQERHSGIAAAMLSKVIERLNNLDAEELRARDIKEWVDIATRVENLSRGEATNITRTVVTTGDQDFITKQQLQREARQFFDETRATSKDMPLHTLLNVIREEFSVTPEELGIDPKLAMADVVQVGEIG